MDQVSIVTQLFEKLSAKEKSEFLDYLNSRNSETEIPETESIEDLILKHSKHPMPDRRECPHCNGIHIVKYGRNGTAQKYKCKDCGKIFSIRTDTVMFGSPKSLETWKKFCKCMIDKFPLRKCAFECNISLHTAFNWRHKILDTLQKMQDSVTLNGITESDETYFHLSFKGSRNIEGREPRRRGNCVSKRGISKEQVCVPTSVDLNGHSIGVCSNLGRPRVQDVSRVITGRIESGSILVTDSYGGYERLAYENSLTHVKIPKGKHVNGTFSIQKINSYHLELKRLVNGVFKGVATKYLNNYIVYNNFVNYAKDSYPNKISILQDFAFSVKCLTRGYLISSRAAIPF